MILLLLSHVHKQKFLSLSLLICLLRSFCDQEKPCCYLQSSWLDFVLRICDSTAEAAFILSIDHKNNGVLRYYLMIFSYRLIAIWMSH